MARASSASMARRLWSMHSIGQTRTHRHSGVLARSVHGSALRHSDCDRLSRHSRTLSARPIRGVRRGRPFHPAPSSAEVIWAKRLCTRVVRIIAESTPTTRDTSWRRVSNDDYSVWRAAGQRTRSDTVCALHGRRSAPGTAAWSQCASVR